MSAHSKPAFDNSLFTFFEELKRNNEREWFQANKSRYESQVVNPLLDFIVEIATPLEKISPFYDAIPKKTGGSMFRIYKDVRFSKDKTPYKEHAACHFRHRAGKDAHAPGFYVHLGTDGIVLGGGIWQPPSDILFKIRDRIRQKPNEWESLIKNRTIKKVFGGIDGDQLIRPPKGFDKELAFIEDIKRKSFFVMRKESTEFALEADFTKEVAKTFKASSPLMTFICKSIGVGF